jgi:hypothetical protein
MDHMSELRRPLGSREACGWVAVAGLVIETRRRFWLALCNSGNTAGSRDRVADY